MDAIKMSDYYRVVWFVDRTKMPIKHKRYHKMWIFTDSEPRALSRFLLRKCFVSRLDQRAVTIFSVLFCH
jgi:hypothetical protein